MKKKIKAVFMMLCMGLIVSSAAFGLDMSEVKAYPVPFNPDKSDGLKLLLPAANEISGIIQISIYDINGDLVFTRNYAKIEHKKNIWNGRNLSGRKVKPGLYIIKITAENDSGNYGKKIIRILVDYK